MPNSTGLYRGQFWLYDNMGRLSYRSNPSEMNSSWAPAGLDGAGWIWTQQSYDWKGRPTVTTNADGTTTENAYGGCGCAGGEVTTVRDERGRRRKLSKDSLGRLQQVDELNWDQSVYATTSYSYNALDEVTSSNEAGQTRSFAYDGHGRLRTRTTPEQGTTTYAYSLDDTVQSITDSRGAVTTFSYDNRRLLTGIAYTVSGNVAGTPNVSFTYDAAGNRLSMTDGLGSAAYAYDTLSQLTSETRTFTGVTGSFTLGYTYNLSGDLTGVTTPWNANVGYSYDKIGRATAVTGSGSVGVTSYVPAITYRAFGLKDMSYQNGNDGNVQDNIETLGNIVRFSVQRYGNYPAVAYWYGPGDPNNAKNAAKNRTNYVMRQ